MRYLVDTHVFLWWLNADKRLKKSTREIIEHPNNQIIASVVNGWEISIKRKTRKLTLKTTVEECFKLASFEVLTISLNHILKLDTLPLYHKDPFDRLLIAQAMVEKLTIITDDTKIRKYNIDVYV